MKKTILDLLNLTLGLISQVTNLVNIQMVLRKLALKNFT